MIEESWRRSGSSCDESMAVWRFDLSSSCRAFVMEVLR